MNRVLKKTANKVWVILFLFFWFLPASVPAAPTTPVQARLVVQGWLARDGSPLGATLGREVGEVQAFPDEQPEIAYFAVSLKPQGFVIVSGDDLVEPIIAFVPRGHFNPSRKNPLGAMVSQDVPQRLAGVRAAEEQAWSKGVLFLPEGAQEQALNKWQLLENLGAESRYLESQGLEAGLPEVSDPRVDPLLKTEWDQDTVPVSGKACYNYYTPPYNEGNAKNYPCGCVATAMAQIMRFHKYPADEVGTDKFWIKVNGKEVQESLRGGDGEGGAYDWDNMAGKPKKGAKPEQLQAIGALTHDAGATIKMEYTSEESSAYTSDVGLALVKVFNYGNAIVGGAEKGIPINRLLPMLNPNLDASLPVQLGIVKKGDKGGHDVVADGYGYNLSTLYHHLNMGWSGLHDAWYNLPIVDLPPPGDYNLVSECLYNVYTEGAGEIISGRVLDADGQPIKGARVKASDAGGGAYADTTNARGIYALTKVPSSSSYTIEVRKAGYGFRQKRVKTGKSTSATITTGNRWGVDFTAVPR